MKKIILILLFISTNFVTIGQVTYQTKEVRIKYSNAVEIFNILLKNPNITFDDKKEYFWYTEFSNIKSTKGGCGGSLLHGNYKLFDKEGNLIADNNYFLGLRDGSFKTWDSVGNIIDIKRYDKDKLNYWKFLNGNYWIEHNGNMFSEGWVKKVFTQFGNMLVEESVGLEGFFNEHTKSYYEFSGKIKQEFYSKSSNHMYGKYVSYFENGKIETEGEFCSDSPIEIKIGTWKWYNQDGTLASQEEYKAEVVKWENGEYRSAGGYLFDTESKQWLKTGEWRWYTETGKFDYSKTYEWGKEIIK